MPTPAPHLKWLGLPACLLGLAASAAAAPADEIQSTAQERESLAVTIYNDALALVRDTRRVTLAQGSNRVALREVSAKIMPETASLRASDGSALALLEQNFDYDLLSDQSLLNKYIGRSVQVIRTHPATGQEQRESATVLSNNGMPVLQYADRVETGLPANARLAFDGVPAQLRDQPTLVLTLQAPQAGAQLLDLSYLTQGIGWRADYVATLAHDENSLGLSGWVTLDNQSGVAYENAQLQLVAGDVGRAPPERYRAKNMEKMAAPAMAAPAPMQQEALFEYHLYTLPRPTTIASQQTKQVALLSANGVPLRKEYRLQGEPHWYSVYGSDTHHSPELGEPRKVDVFVEFDNKGGDLGVPLPKGVVRVYKADSKGRALFIGEDRIDHKAKDEQVRLKLGSAFDLNGTWKRLAVDKLSNKLYEIRVQIELRNAKEVPATIKVVEPIHGHWTMQKESHPHSKAASGLAQWNVEVPAGGKTVLDYTVRIQY
ncbi:DUF4139 domain-containing protein [Vandammella animalimorsus]|uniref:DUF4139 domain-containing protein n=1 Tax=Vandammella animalimorsus TaxID=2029117 RepID=A0A3M6R237_9BURK|nr:DUF4139 domain-containing protein [Vandammella animalimorsus]RMX09338.1 DUF4139 domain-containing protein [Vandammella animalimorsus]